jgi:hypothetical protein
MAKILKRISYFNDEGVMSVESIPLYEEFPREYSFELVNDKAFCRERITNPDRCPQVSNNFEQLAYGNGNLRISEFGVSGGEFYIQYVDDKGRIIETVYLERYIGMELEFDIKLEDDGKTYRNYVKFLYDEVFGNIIRIWEYSTSNYWITTALEDGKVIAIEITKW